jgi:hypothetical protein
MQLAPRPDDLATAIILLERLAIGPGGHRERSRLPSLVRLQAEVIDRGPIACAVSAEAVRMLAHSDRAPTWGDLQRVWQDVSALLQLRIRATGNTRGSRAARPSAGDEVTLTASDLPQSLARSIAPIATTR